jgi:uncharacterized membrane protein
MRTQNKALRRLAEGGLIAAMYTALALAVPAASFGLAQFRVSEILTILPVFTPAAIPGLAVGCMVSNIVGLAMGANLAGAWDILFGSLATLAAAWMTYWLRNFRIKGMPVLATLPPILINAFVVGLELTLVLLGFSWVNYSIAILYVAAGQFGACTVCGLILHTALSRSGAERYLFQESK